MEKDFHVTASGSGFVPGAQTMTPISSPSPAADGVVRLKADPYAFHAETRPGTASKLLIPIDAMLGGRGMAAKKSAHGQPVYTAPLNIY